VAVSVSFPLPQADQAAVAGIDLQFAQRPAAAQELDLVDPAAVLALQLDLHDLTGVLTFEAVEDRPQRQDLARLEGLTRPVVVVILAAPVTSGGGAGTQGEQQSCAGDGGTAAAARQSSIRFHGKLDPCSGVVLESPFYPAADERRMNGGFTFRSLRRRHSTPHPDTAEETRMNRKNAVSALAATLVLSLPTAATAATHAELLAGLATAAKAANPSFVGFSVERGRILQQQSFAGGKPETPACTSCHGSNPRAAGRTPSGKSIDPLAVSVSPARYTDPAKVEKWFRRNCIEVLGRECSALEKGDWLSYVIGQ